MGTRRGNALIFKVDQQAKNSGDGKKNDLEAKIGKEKTTKCVKLMDGNDNACQYSDDTLSNERPHRPAADPVKTNGVKDRKSVDEGDKTINKPIIGPVKLYEKRFEHSGEDTEDNVSKIRQSIENNDSGVCRYIYIFF